MAHGDSAVGRDVLRTMAGVPEYKTVTLNKYLVAIVEDLVKIANCRSGAEQHCAIPFKIVIRRGAVDFIVKSGRISIRRNVVTVETEDGSVMVNGDFGTVSLIRNSYFLDRPSLDFVMHNLIRAWCVMTYADANAYAIYSAFNETYKLEKKFKEIIEDVEP